MLGQAEAALELAHDAVERSKARESAAAIVRATTADERQLAADVLLDSIDHLRAAALAVFSASRPRLTAVLAAPLESRPRTTAESDDEEPAPAPEPPAS